MDVCVLVRVYDRLADLPVCLDAIAVHWHRHRYHVIVASNGRPDGYPLPPQIASRVEVVVECADNDGHVAGSGALLRAGLRHVPACCRYTVLLEADVWLHSDRVLHRYLQRMEAEDAVWASAIWVEKYRSLAVDVAIVRSALFLDHPALFDFDAHAEHHVARYLDRHALPVLHLAEHMPVHVPRVMRAFSADTRGRFHAFPEGEMVTHHLEDLPGGLDEKMRIANATLGRREYPVPDSDNLLAAHRRLVWRQRLARVVPRSSWVRRQRQPPATWTVGTRRNRDE